WCFWIRSPRPFHSFPLAYVQPGPGTEAETNETVEESVSINTTLLAAAGPRFVTKTVKVTMSPMETDVGAAVAITIRSADAGSTQQDIFVVSRLRDQPLPILPPSSE